MKLRYKLPLILSLLLTAYLSITAALALICYPDPHVEKLSCFAEKLELGGIVRAARVNENLYRGGLPNKEGLAALKALGVRTFIDLHGVYESNDYPEAVKSSGFNYIVMHLSEKPPGAETVREFLSIVSDPRNQPVFVHCKRGKVRTSVMLAIFRIRREGWKNEDAFNEMLYFGFNTFHRETFFFGSCKVHTELAEFIKNYRPPRPPAGRVESTE